MAEIIVALDFASADDAMAMVDLLGTEGDFYKVGLELYTRAGPEIVRSLTQTGRRIFLDLKLHDIPNTVVGGVRAAADLGDISVIHWGQVITRGTPDELRANPWVQASNLGKLA